MMRNWIFVVCILGVGWAARIPSFMDVSKKIGLLSFDQMKPGNPTRNKYWGSTVADFDRDGHYDLFLCNHANNPELYFMKSGRTYSFTPPQLGGVDLHATAAADVDNDGYLDFVVNTGGRNGNNVRGHPIVSLVHADQSFERHKNGVHHRDHMGLNAQAHRGRAMMFMDMNADGYLDLLLLNQRNLSATESHIVYQNLGNGRFRIRSDTGIEGSKGYWGHVIDANNDSHPDVLIIGWMGLQLWLGTGDFRFTDGTHLIGDAAAMKLVRCVAEIDFDGDGDLDLVFARGSTKSRQPGRPADVILENQDGVYRRVKPHGLGSWRHRNHFHVTVGDFNNDGLMDMYFSVMTHFHAPRLPDWMYLNEGGGRFSLAPKHGTESTKRDSDGDNAVAFDYNLDGRLDLLVGSRNDAWKLYKNNSRRTGVANNHYILVRVGEPRGQLERPNELRRKALGALVKVRCGRKVLLQRVGSPGQSHSQSYMDTLHFGLGSCSRVDSIEVQYTGKVVVTRGSTAADRLVTIGMYYNCPAGRIGKDCNKRMARCSTSQCRNPTECETVAAPDGQRLHCPL